MASEPRVTAAGDAARPAPLKLNDSGRSRASNGSGGTSTGSSRLARSRRKLSAQSQHNLTALRSHRSHYVPVDTSTAEKRPGRISVESLDAMKASQQEDELMRVHNLRMGAVALLSIFLYILDEELRWSSGPEFADTGGVFDHSATSPFTILDVLIPMTNVVLVYYLIELYKHMAERVRARWGLPSAWSAFWGGPLKFRFTLELLLLLVQPLPRAAATAVRGSWGRHLGLLYFLRLYIAARILRDHDFVYRHRHQGEYAGQMTARHIDFSVAIRAQLKRRPAQILLSLLGLMIIVFTYAMYVIERDSLFRGVPDVTIKSMTTSLWFVIITLTTIGYGDHSPSNSHGYWPVILEAFMGVVITSLVVGIVIDKLSVKGQEERMYHWVQTRVSVQQLQELSKKIISDTMFEWYRRRYPERRLGTEDARTPAGSVRRVLTGRLRRGNSPGGSAADMGAGDSARGGMAAVPEEHVYSDDSAGSYEGAGGEAHGDGEGSDGDGGASSTPSAGRAASQSKFTTPGRGKRRRRAPSNHQRLSAWIFAHCQDEISKARLLRQRIRAENSLSVQLQMIQLDKNVCSLANANAAGLEELANQMLALQTMLENVLDSQRAIMTAMVQQNRLAAGSSGRRSSAAQAKASGKEFGMDLDHLADRRVDDEHHSGETNNGAASRGMTGGGAFGGALDLTGLSDMGGVGAGDVLQSQYGSISDKLGTLSTQIGGTIDGNALGAQGAALPQAGGVWKPALDSPSESSEGAAAAPKRSGSGEGGAASARPPVAGHGGEAALNAALAMEGMSHLGVGSHREASPSAPMTLHPDADKHGTPPPLRLDAHEGGDDSRATASAPPAPASAPGAGAGTASGGGSSGGGAASSGRRGSGSRLGAGAGAGAAVPGAGAGGASAGRSGKGRRASKQRLQAGARLAGSLATVRSSGYGQTHSDSHAQPHSAPRQRSSPGRQLRAARAVSRTPAPPAPAAAPARSHGGTSRASGSDVPALPAAASGTAAAAGESAESGTTPSGLAPSQIRVDLGSMLE